MKRITDQIKQSETWLIILFMIVSIRKTMWCLPIKIWVEREKECYGEPSLVKTHTLGGRRKNVQSILRMRRGSLAYSISQVMSGAHANASICPQKIEILCCKKLVVSQLPEYEGNIYDLYGACNILRGKFFYPIGKKEIRNRSRLLAIFWNNLSSQGFFSPSDVYIGRKGRERKPPSSQKRKRPWDRGWSKSERFKGRGEKKSWRTRLILREKTTTCAHSASCFWNADR